MRIIIILLLFFTILPISHAGEGSGGGGPRPSRDLQFILNKVQVGPGGGGGTPIKPGDSQLLLKNISIIDDKLINRIDNIEVNNEVRFPESFREKVELLKTSKVQSIQLIDGQIIYY